MTLQAKALILGFLIVATIMEAMGDALVRMGLTHTVPGGKAVYFAGGALLLFSYGLTLNLAPIAFEKVIGIYLAMLFVTWQVISFLMFKTTPNLPVLVGGSLIVVGGLLVAFWRPDASAA